MQVQKVRRKMRFLGGLVAALATMFVLTVVGSYILRAQGQGTLPLPPAAQDSGLYLPLIARPPNPMPPALPLTAYDIGTPVLQDIWVDPVAGNDANSGAARASALRTLTAAWGRIPDSADAGPITTGYRIQLVAGVYPEANFPNYWEARHGTYTFPIILNSVDGPGAAQLRGNVNVFDVHYFYLLGLEIVNDGDVFHCEQCRYLLIREAHLDGGDRSARETVKVNQSQHVYIEASDIHGAHDNPIDFVAVQYGHLLGNRVHDAGDWCAYVKGGSAFLNIEGNEFFNCSNGGFTAGQGTGFEWMTNPWLHYEAYAIRIVNNVVHHTVGAGLGVNGGYQILLAHNTLYQVGERSHLFEAVFGLRSCDGNRTDCAANNAAGGWGNDVVGGEGEPIPNHDVYFINNLIVNSDGYRTGWQHFAIYGPRTPAAGTNIPTPAQTDTNLRIHGNVIWNGPTDWPLGVGDRQGCQPTNPACNAEQLAAENAINTVEPQLVDPLMGNFRLANPADLPLPVAIPDFPAWQSFTPPVIGATLPVMVPVDYAGQLRSAGNLVGAYAASTADGRNY